MAREQERLGCQVRMTPAGAIEDGSFDLVRHAEQVTLLLEPVTASVPAARHFIERVLPSTCWAEEVPLLVSELASNAVRHAGTPFSLSLSCDGAIVRIEVRDRDPTLPVRLFPPVDAVTGRGLLIVDALSDRWGVEPDPDGKTVWCEVVCRSTIDSDHN